MFGGDWPVCLLGVEKYADWLNALKTVVKDRKEDAAEEAVPRQRGEVLRAVIAIIPALRSSDGEETHVQAQRPRTSSCSTSTNTTAAGSSQGHCSGSRPTMARRGVGVREAPQAAQTGQANQEGQAERRRQRFAPTSVEALVAILREEMGQYWPAAALEAPFEKLKAMMERDGWRFVAGGCAGVRGQPQRHRDSRRSGEGVTGQRCKFPLAFRCGSAMSKW